MTWTVRNGGEVSATGTSADRVYVSASGTLADATLLATAPHTGDLAVGGTYDGSAVVTVPALADGAYRIVVVTDALGAVGEGQNEGNNLRASGAFQVGHADLVPTITSAPPSAVSGSPITVEFSVNNAGSAPAAGVWNDRIYLSADDKWDANDAPLGNLAAYRAAGRGGGLRRADRGHGAGRDLRRRTTSTISSPACPRRSPFPPARRRSGSRLIRSTCRTASRPIRRWSRAMGSRSRCSTRGRTRRFTSSARDARDRAVMQFPV